VQRDVEPRGKKAGEGAEGHQDQVNQDLLSFITA
jgi:hypothetical protein